MVAVEHLQPAVTEKRQLEIFTGPALVTEERGEGRDLAEGTPAEESLELHESVLAQEHDAFEVREQFEFVTQVPGAGGQGFFRNVRVRGVAACRIGQDETGTELLEIANTHQFKQCLAKAVNGVWVSVE